jgi:hypothetical protein
VVGKPWLRLNGGSGGGLFGSSTGGMLAITFLSEQKVGRPKPTLAIMFAKQVLRLGEYTAFILVDRNS